MKKLLCIVLSVVMLSACSSTTGSTTTATTDTGTGEALYTAGTYTGTAQGNNGPVTVKWCLLIPPLNP